MCEKNQNSKATEKGEMTMSEKIKMLEELNKEIELKGEYMAKLEGTIEAFMIANNIKEMTLPDGLTITLNQ